MSKKGNPCETAIYNTLAYRSIFKYPLTEYQLKSTLVSTRRFKEQYFCDELARLVKKGTVKVHAGKYYISGYKPVDWDKRAKYSQKLMSEAKEIAKILGIIPWIKFIGVTGAVAAYNADNDADIDFFIITAKNRIWVSRLFVVLLLKTLGKYRTDKSPKGKVCPNLYVDETKLNWPKDKRNLLVAHEIILMHPILSRGNTYFKFMKANQWIFDHFKNFDISFSVRSHKERTPSKIIDFVETLSRKSQIAYMKPKITNEVVERGMIHFNRDDWTAKILDKYEILTR